MPMRVLPVIDLQQGVAVHGRAGRRSEYRPVKSVLATDASPVALTKSILRELGLDQLYVADLDAIAGRCPDWSVYQALIDSGMQLWIDAGISDEPRIDDLFDRLGEAVIGVLGLETLAGPAALQRMLTRHGPDRLVVSLDLDAGIPRTGVSAWKRDDALTIACRLIDWGVTRMILLDLTRIGIGQGTGTTRLLRALRANDPGLQIFCGGGCTDVESIRQLAEWGCDGVLLATSLHDGRIGRAELDEIRSWPLRRESG